MKKLAIVFIAVVLCAFMCVSCKPEPNRQLSGTYFQSYADKEGTAHFQVFEFFGSKVYLYTRQMKLIDEGEFVLNGNTLDLALTGNRRYSYSFQWIDDRGDFVKIGGYTYNNTSR